MMVATAAPTTLWRVDDDGRLRISPHPGQMAALDSEARFTFVIAGTQGGKTSFGPFWLYREIQREGPGDYLAVTSTFPLLKLKMLPEFLRLFRETLDLGVWRTVDKVFQFHDGETRVIFGSASNSESLESATAKGAWLDECGQDDFRLESWEAIQRRLSLHQGRVFGGTTPYNLGWIKQQIYDRWRDGDPDYRVIQFASIINPMFPSAEDERAKRTLPEWKYQMFYRGQFERPAGLIYDAFIDRYRDDGGHKIHSFEIPSHWPRYLGLDFGGVNTAKIYAAKDPISNVIYVYAASLSGGKTTVEHTNEVKKDMAGLNYITAWGGAKSEEQWRMDWRAAGVNVQTPRVADVEGGIDRVIEALKTYRLYVFDTCRGLLDEFGTYSREIGADGEPTEKIKDKETFHRLDGLRYLVPGVFQQGRVFVA